ncbi:MAG: hypothetical protein JO322_13070 [Candidatus Eremiobacteraeota bacterium]|nr:hypothetical protein [Candidatus Eremiobacteraeota bacterium]
MALPHLARRFFCVSFALMLAACSGSKTYVPAGPQMAPQAVQPLSSAEAVTEELQPDAGTSGPIVYICDTNTKLWTVNIATKTVHFVGYLHAQLTDIGFDPVNHVLYGIDFYSFYRVSTTTGRATFIGSLGITDANALVFDAHGRGYTKGFRDTSLYAINNVATGHVTSLGSTGAWESAGDLTFYDGQLVLSGFTGPDPYGLDSLVFLNRSNGAVLGVHPTNLSLLYGLVATAPGVMYGFANTSLYRIFPTASTTAGRTVLLKNLASEGVQQITGSAYNGYYQ